MEGRSADEAHERALIAQMSDAERLAGFRREVQALCAKWKVPQYVVDLMSEVAAPCAHLLVNVDGPDDTRGFCDRCGQVVPVGGPSPQSGTDGDRE